MDTSLIKVNNKLSKDNKRSLEDQGKQIYKKNEFMKDLANVMEHPEFKDFFGKYFTDWTSTQSMLMLMKVYESMHAEFPDMNGFHRLALVDTIIHNSRTRKEVVKVMKEWKNEEK